jgi:hypothetical protein
MNFIELQGVDHKTVLCWDDWEAMLSLAYRAGWRTRNPGRIIFRPHNTWTLPSWACPPQEGETRIASAREARKLALALKTATVRHQKAPPPWWHRNEADRLQAWPAFLHEAWEVVYLLGGGSVSVAVGETFLTA